MLSILLPINKHSRYFTQAIDSLVTSIAVADIPTQLVIVLNNLKSEDRIKIEYDLGFYPFVKEVVETLAGNLSEVLNFGLEFCIYDLIARMDSDDITLPNRFKEQIACLIENPDVAAVGGQIGLIDSEDQLKGKVGYPTNFTTNDKKLRYANYFAHPAVMFRKSCVLAVGAYKDDYPVAEDYFLWARLNQKWSLRNLSTRVLNYRIHENQTTANNYALQIISTLRIMAIGFEVNQNSLKCEMDEILNSSTNKFLRNIFSSNSVARNNHFKAAIAIMILRRKLKLSGNWIFQFFYLFIVAVRSDPIALLKEFRNYVT
jgi:glycosyltransferase involved in cell wall biosynthesis